jgi:photosystem II stability/assembly factor-like uncharacterized protein
MSGGTTNFLCSVYFTDANAGYAVGTGGTILKTTDGGTTWNPLASGTTASLNSVCFTDANTGYVAGGTDSLNFATILKTTDGGSTWLPLSSGMTGAGICSVYFTDSNTGFAVGGFLSFPADYGFILKTTDGGVTWTYTAYAEWTLHSICFSAPNTGFAVGDYGTMLKTTDGGTNWSVIDLGVGVAYCESMCFTDSNTGYIVGSKGTIVKTSDGGNSWNLLESGSESELESICFPTATTGYTVGYGGTILATNNGGGFPVGVNEIKQVAGTLKLFPNPTSGNLTIEAPDKGTLIVYDINGVLLLQRELVESTTTIDFSSLPGGVYMVKLVGVKGVQVGKFVKQ